MKSLLFLLLLAGTAFGQSTLPLLEVRELSRITLRWSADQGLPSDRIDNLIQTPDGYLWVSAGRKIARLKAGEFEVFNPTTILGEYIANINRFCVDPEGTLWMFARNKRVITYREGRFSLMPVEQSNTLGIIATAVSSGPGELLAFPNNKQWEGARAITPTGWKQEIATLSTTGKIVSTDREAYGMVWLKTSAQKLYLLEKKTPRHVKVIAPSGKEERKLSNLFRDQNRRLLVAGTEAIYHLHNGEAKIEFPFKQSLGDRFNLEHAAVDNDLHYWIQGGTEDLLVIPNDGTPRKVDLGDIDFSPPVFRLISSRDGSVWVATFGGLIQISYSPFVTWTLPEKELKHRLVATSESPDGHLWFTGLGAICRLMPDSQGLETIVRQRIPRIGEVFAESKNSALWFKPSGKLFRLTDSGQEQLGGPIFPKNNNPTVRSSTLTHEGHYVLVAENALFIHPCTKKGNFSRLPLPSPLNQAILGSLITGSEGELYISTRNRGVFRYELADHTATPVSDPDKPRPDRCYTLHQDSDGDLWGFSHPNSTFNWVTNGEHFALSLADLGLSESPPFGIVTDQADGMWFTTPALGVGRMSLEALQRKMRDPSVEIKIEWFDQSKGLGTKAGSYIPAGIFKASDGRIWIASSAGASVIDPVHWVKRREKATPYPVVINELRLDNHTVDRGELSGETITVPPSIDEISFSYAALNYDRLGAPAYRVRLKGFEDAWQEVDQRREVFYQRLPPGNYQFEVMASSADGQWNGEAATVPIKIEAAWWQLSWVRLFGVLIIGGLIFFLYRLQISVYRRKQSAQIAFSQQLIDSQEQERKRIAGELHDGLGQHLLIIKNSSELAQQQLGNPEVSASRISSITDLASDAISEVRAITANLRPPSLDRLGLVTALESLAESARTSSGITVACRVEALDFDCPPETQMHIFRIFQESLNNALKHSKASKIALLAIEHPPHLDLVIQDDGKGFDSKQSSANLGSGMGLESLRERARILGGAISIESTPGQGTCVKAQLSLSSLKNDD